LDPAHALRPFKAFIHFTWLSLFIVFGPLAPAKADHGFARVLFISSYDPSFHSFLPQLNGLKAGLSENGAGLDQLELNVEFMDTKRLRSAENTASFRDRLAFKLNELPPSQVIIAGDDNALKFILQERAGLFADLPIVFLGVNDANLAARLESDPQVTGVTERPSLGKTLALAERFLSRDGAVHVITDVTRTSVINMSLLRETPEYRRLQDRVRVLKVPEQSFAELFERIGRIGPGSAILLISGSRDKNGETLSNTEMAHRIHAAAKVPFFHPWEYSMGHGALGGYVVSHFEQGRAAGRIVARVLDGAAPGDIPIDAESSNVFTVDYRVLKEFGFSKSQLPPGATFLNEPSSLYERYRTWIWLLAGFLVLQSGAIVTLVVLNRRLGRAEKMLNDALIRTQEANDAKSRFLASMSHELRTPLNPILGFSQMLQLGVDGPLNDGQSEKLQQVVTGAEHLLRLVDDILDLVRIEADQMEVQIEEINCRELVGQCVGWIEQQCAARGIRIENRLRDSGDVMVKTDKDRFSQVVSNVLTNAVKYNRDQGSITISGELAENGYYLISIADTGIGIPDERKSDIFELFGGRSRDPEIAAGGAGLGLGVSKRIVERLGGWIEFESTEGEGSCFQVSVPLATNSDVLIWTDDLRVGIDEIDCDHQVIFKLANFVSRSTLSQEEMEEIVRSILKYTYFHFRREEAIMEAIGHPDLKRHAADHQRLLKRLKSIEASWNSKQDADSLRDIQDFLRDWWHAHIIPDDSKIGPYAQGREADIHRALEAKGLIISASYHIAN